MALRPRGTAAGHVVLLSVFLLAFLTPAFSAVEQVHLALGSTDDAIFVEFVASVEDEYTVAFGTDPLLNSQHIALSYVTSSLPGVGFMHRAEMTGLRARTKYYYGIAEPNANVLAGPFSFTTPPEPGAPTSVAFYADFGFENAASLPQLSADVAAGAFDAILHGGDIAYDLFEEGGEQGSRFMRALEPVAANVPYMVAVGNHEHDDNFLQYLARFDAMRAGAGAASGSNTSFFYSFDLGLVHYVAIDTELYAYQKQTSASLSPVTVADQLAWLERDLAQADANRAAVPWVVAFGHKGWYMAYFRTPENSFFQVDFSDFARLFDKFNVDLYLSGHNHIYQRFLPLSAPIGSPPDFQGPARDVDAACASGPTNNQVYTDPLYTTHIVVGSPGNRELTRLGDCEASVGEWKQLANTMAACVDGYGFGVLSIPNRTHLNWKWKMTSRPNVPDKFSWDLLQTLERLVPFRRRGARPLPPKADVPYRSDEVWIVRTDEGRERRAAERAEKEGAGRGAGAGALAGAAQSAPRRSGGQAQAGATSSDALWEGLLRTLGALTGSSSSSTEAAALSSSSTEEESSSSTSSSASSSDLEPSSSSEALLADIMYARIAAALFGGRGEWGGGAGSTSAGAAAAARAPFVQGHGGGAAAEGVASSLRAGGGGTDGGAVLFEE